MKPCTVCGVVKQAEDFHLCKNGKGGRAARCRVCAAEYDKKYAIENAERRKIYKQKYREANRDKITAYNESRRDKQREYYRANAVQIKQYQKNHRQENHGKRKSMLETNIVKRVIYLVNGRRSDARRRKLDFSIVPNDILNILIIQNNRCALTGIQFDLSFDDRYRAAPFSPSIDRKDSAQGYTPDNIQMVCFAANMGKGEYPQSTFDAMCRARVAVLSATDYAE